MDWQDEEFEAYLRQFRLRKPRALPTRRRVLVAMMVAAVLLIAVIMPMRSWRTGSNAGSTPLPATPSALPSPAEGMRQADGRNVRLTTAVNRIPQVEVTLAAYRPTSASAHQVSVSLPAIPARKPLNAPKPQYPPEAQRVGLGGTVELRLTVSPAGEVTKTERLTSGVDLRPDDEQAPERADYYAKHPYAFALEAENAAKQWTFEPARSAMAVVVSFAFRLKSSADLETNPPALSGSPALSPVNALQRPGPLPSSASGRVSTGGGNRRLKVGGTIKAPLRLVNVNPVYPEDAKAAGIEGVVILQVVIGEDGSVIDAQVLQSIPELVQAALDAVYQWQYEPTLLNGEPVELEIIVTINFTLQ